MMTTEIRTSSKGGMVMRTFVRNMILAAAVILLLSSVQDVLQAFRSEELLQSGFHHTFLMNALTSDAMTLALPIIAALPFTASFIDDVKSGFVKEYLPRTTKNGYL